MKISRIKDYQPQQKLNEFISSCNLKNYVDEYIDKFLLSIKSVVPILNDEYIKNLINSNLFKFIIFKKNKDINYQKYFLILYYIIIKSLGI